MQADTLEREVPVQSLDTGMASLITRQEIDLQISTAMKYPRSVKSFKDTALQLATLDESTAQECIYALPRDGKTIEGPSARFAEIIVYSWKHCRAGARVVDESGEFVTSQGVFMDLQQNIGIAYEVQRRIVDRNGRRYKPDMVGVTANAACSIALRNAILKGVPKAIWNPIYQAARHVVMGDFKTLANRREEAIKQFVAYGVTLEQICGVLGVKGKEDIGMEQLVVLRGTLTAIQEGDTTVEQAFSNGHGEREPIRQPESRSGQAASMQAPAEAGQENPAPHTNGNGASKAASPGHVKNTQMKLKAKADELGVDEAALLAECFTALGLKTFDGSMTTEQADGIQKWAKWKT